MIRGWIRIFVGVESLHDSSEMECSILLDRRAFIIRNFDFISLDWKAFIVRNLDFILLGWRGLLRVG